MNVTIVLRRSLESRLAPASGSARTIHALSTQPRTNFFAQPCKCFRNKLGGPGRSSPCIHGTYNDACCAASCLLRRDPHGERRWNSTRDVRPRLESSCEWIWPYLAEREREAEHSYEYGRRKRKELWSVTKSLKKPCCCLRCSDICARLLGYL